jgi:glutamate--cysteine ligase
VALLLDRLEADLRSLAVSLEAGGVEVVARGVDPRAPLEAARLHLDGERYRRQARHYDRLGDWGRRMMRQSAALHLNVDPVGEGWESWRLTNALAPVLTALFANSPRIAGEESGWRSSRAAQWRNLDPGRTGVFGGEADPPATYAARVLEADSFLLGEVDEPARSFRSWMESGRVGIEAWRTHLTTFFPEVRPRGYLEVRCVDALPLRWVGVPLLLLTGLLRHPTSLRSALEILPESDEAALVRAGRRGMEAPEVARLGREVMAVAHAGLLAPGYRRVPPRWIDRMEEFADRFTRRSRDPGHDPSARFA